MKTAGINGALAMDATNLTQLSSREQLSALMDGALPADETRFLLRRLQHDASLAESWERWRLSAEVMRGLAPTERLPADFASRVAASLRGEDRHAEVLLETAATSLREVRAPAWLRWGGGVAVAASVAVVAFMIQPAALKSPGNLQDNTVVAAVDAASSRVNNTIAVTKAPLEKSPAPPAPAQDPAGGMGLESQTAALASAVAAIARPTRNNRRDNQPRTMQLPSIVASTPTLQVAAGGIAAAGNIAPLLPRSDIITRPWPRSVLPHTGGPGLTVGFGDSARSPEIYNPFQLRTGIDSTPPALIVEPIEPPAPPARNATTPASNQTDRANGEPQS